MRISEYKKLLNQEEKEKKAFISVNQLKDRSDGTLLYGYDCNRNTYHMYLKNEEFNIFIYTSEKVIFYNNYKDKLPIDQRLLPNKRLHPERCDYEICKLLKDEGIHLPFTKYNEEIVVKQYYGRVKEG